MVGEEHLWPIDDVWSFHAGGQEFQTVMRFVDALVARYGAVANVEELRDVVAGRHLRGPARDVRGVHAATSTARPA